MDIGSESIKAVVAEQKAESEPLRVLGAAMVLSEGVRKGEVANPQALVPKIREAAREAERSSGIPFRKAWVAFGSAALGFQKSEGRVPSVRGDREFNQYDVARALKQAEPPGRALLNREILTHHPLGFSVDSELRVKDPAGLKGENLETEVLYITSLSRPLHEFVQAVEATGLAVEDILPSPIAAARSLLTNRQREVGALVLDIGAQTTGLAVFEENLPFSLSVFPFGSAHITNDIALGFRVNLGEAEKIKLGAFKEETREARRKLSDIIEARLEDMFELVQGHLKKNGRAGLLPGGVVLGGGGSRLSGLGEFARDSLKLPSEHGRCAELEENNKLKDPIWAVAVGTCLLALDDETEGAVSPRRPSIFGKKITSWFKSLIP